MEINSYCNSLHKFSIIANRARILFASGLIFLWPMKSSPTIIRIGNIYEIVFWNSAWLEQSQRFKSSTYSSVFKTHSFQLNRHIILSWKIGLYLKMDQNVQLRCKNFNHLYFSMDCCKPFFIDVLIRNSLYSNVNQGMLITADYA